MPTSSRRVVTTTTKRKTKITKQRRRRLGYGITNSPKGIYKFVRTLDSTNITIGNINGGININNLGFLTLTTTATQGTQYFSWSPAFQISDLPDYTEFTNLFDRYRLRGVKLTLIPIANMSAYQLSTPAATNQALSGFMHSVIDYDDATAFAASSAGLAQMHEYATHKTTRITSSKKMFIRPKLAMAIYQGAFTGYGQNRNIWVDCNTAAQYYGVKFLWEIFVPSATVLYVNYKVECKYYLELKDLR